MSDPTPADDRFVTIARIGDVAPGELRLAEIEGLPPLVIANVDGELHVLDDTCSHGKASLSEGYLDPGPTIECPWHGGKFCVLTGAALSLPAAEPIRHHETRVVGDALQIVRPEDD